MRGYEVSVLNSILSFFLLRIPMRGYETLRRTTDVIGDSVTNPHAGL